MWTQEEIKALRQMYSDVRISREKMVEYFERTWQVICVKARKLGLSRPRVSRNQINHDYFREITTSEQAYWLGWLAADGHVALWKRCYTICLELQKEDLCIVEGFRHSVAPGVPIHETAKSYYVRFGSKAMFQDLAIYGIGPNKTEHFVWPSSLPETFASDFILGYFDGDGCLGRYTNGRKKRFFWILNGTKLFLNTVKCYLDSKAQVKLSEPILVHKDRSPHLFKIVASSREAVCRIDALINASGLGLPRKHL
jgi:hypothetical protein